MSHAFEIASVGLRAQQQALDIHANNIANLNTTYFKRSEVRFADMVGQGDPASSAGVAAQSVLALNARGELQSTGHALDLAVDGLGFIELMGPRGEVHLWRGGRLSIDAQGQLTTEAGDRLRANITVPREAVELEIAADGVVRARIEGQEAESLGAINLVRVDDPDALVRLDGGVYKVAEGAYLQDAVPGEDGAGRLVQGSIERSNVELNSEMVQLMIVQRSYAANAQILQAADQMLAVVNNLRR